MLENEVRGVPMLQNICKTIFKAYKNKKDL